MGDPFSGYANGAGVVDRGLGTAYETVKSVAEALAVIQHVSANMEAVFAVSEMKDVMQEFTANPDFLTFLQSAQGDLAELADAFNAMSGNLLSKVAATNKLTGYTALGTNAPYMQQQVMAGTTPAAGAEVFYNLPSGLTSDRLRSAHILIDCADGTLRPPGSIIDVLFSATQLKLVTHAGVGQGAARPFKCLLSFVDAG